MAVNARMLMGLAFFLKTCPIEKKPNMTEALKTDGLIPVMKLYAKSKRITITRNICGEIFFKGNNR